MKFALVEYFEDLLKSRVSRIRVTRIRVTRGPPVIVNGKI